MKKALVKTRRTTLGRRTAGRTAAPAGFAEVLTLIEAARTRAVKAVNTALIELYWSIGEHITEKVGADGWGKGTVQALAEYIQRRHAGMTGFSSQNLWRMRQFYETYRDLPELSALLRELPWTHNLLIMSRAKGDEERTFYLRMARDQRWTSRELERQLNGALFERVVLSPTKLSAPLRELRPDATSVFKDSYLVEFLNLPRDYSEADLHRGLVEQLKNFLIELGRDFCFVGSYYPIQVGGRDFEIDLLFFHRGLNCLVDIELKTEQFQPEHLGKLGFYLEALDRNVKKPHERQSIGVLLCATKDHEVVEYALSRAASPTVVAEYKTQLPNKKLLQNKLHEFYALASEQAARPAPKTRRPGKSAKSRRK